MIDKVQKIRKEVEMVVNRRLNLLNGDYFDLNKEVDDFTNEIMNIIDSLQEEPKIPQVFDEGYWERLGEEPVSKEIGDYDHKAVMESLHPELKEAPVSKDLEIAANEWDAKASFTPFYMALDDNGNPYEIKQDYTTHAESFKAGAKWQKEKEYTCYEEAFEDGAKWQKEHMMIKAIKAHCFGFQGAALFSFRLPADNYLVGSEVKVIVIKED